MIQFQIVLERVQEWCLQDQIMAGLTALPNLLDDQALDQGILVGAFVLGKPKGLQIQRLIGSAVAGFNHGKTITKASATDLHARQDEFNTGI